MTLLIALTLFFIWLIIREFIPNRNSPNRIDGYSLVYVGILASLAILCGSYPYKYWKFETMLSEVASEFAGGGPVDVHCNSLFDSIFMDARRLGLAGQANLLERKITFQFSWCTHLMNYLESPDTTDRELLYSLTVLTHEIMHIRGEINEQKTECQSVQRNYAVAKRLGVPDHLAKKHAKHHYKVVYPRHPYFSKNCVRGNKWDERLPNPIW